MSKGGLHATITARTTTINDRIRTLKGELIRGMLQEKRLTIVVLTYPGALSKEPCLVVSQLLVLVPITSLIREIDNYILRLSDRSRRGTTFMAACHITFSTIPTTVGEILKIETLRFTSRLFFSVTIAVFLVLLLTSPVVSGGWVSLVCHQSLFIFRSTIASIVLELKSSLGTALAPDMLLRTLTALLRLSSCVLL